MISKAVEMSKQSVTRMIEQFRNAPEVSSPAYKEIWVREQFIDPLLYELGWEKNKPGAVLLDGLVSEDRLRSLGMVKSPDYACYISGKRQFFIEAKKPSVNIEKSSSPAYQIRKYGWNADVPVGILTDFEEFGFYDCRVAPNLSDSTDRGRFEYFRYEDLLDRWDWIAGLFSRESITAGSLQDFVLKHKKVPGAIPIGEAFLLELDRFRLLLAKDIVSLNQIEATELSEIVQLFLDRIIFLRICESRDIESDGMLLDVTKKVGIINHLTKIFIQADQRYNSGLFLQHKLIDKKGQEIKFSDQTLKKVIEGLYPPSPYEFSLIGSDVLSQVYERFLGKIIVPVLDKVKIQDRPEVKKAGGVIYTPANIVRHMVSSVFAELSKSGVPLADIKICDPACGSGSFLVEVYDELCHLFLQEYVKSIDKFSGGRNPKVVSDGTGDWILSSLEKKRILRDHVFGVDLDPQAVEVTKLSLLLKVLEGETGIKLDRQLELFREQALPDLNDNIQCGNSLVGLDISKYEEKVLLDVGIRKDIKPFDWHRAFPSVFKRIKSGFDLIVGNPPYILLEGKFRNPITDLYFREEYEVASFKIDTYHLFFERALSLLTNNGMLVFITPTNWMTNNNLEELRKLLLRDSQIISIEVLDNSAFKGRSVDTAIVTLQRGTECVSKFPQKRISSAFTPPKVISLSEIDPAQIHNSAGLLFSAGEYSANSIIYSKFEGQVQTLGDIARVNFGKQLRDRKKFKQDVITVNKESEIPKTHRACYTGKDIGRWYANWSGLACLDSDIAQSGGCWNAEVQNAQNKLLCKQIGLFPEFGLDVEGRQCLNTAFMITINDGVHFSPRVLSALLNSSLISAYWLDQFWDRRYTFPKIKGTFLKELPIPLHIDPNVANNLELKVKIAEQLTSETRTESNPTKIKNLSNLLAGIEEEIDLLVCEVYGLDSSALDTLRATIVAVQKLK